MTGYLLHAASGEAKILLSRRSIDDVLSRRDLDAAKKEKLKMVQRAADDAQRLLGLKRQSQYREYAQLSTDFAVWVLTLAEPDRLELVSWKFPIVGRVPYLGFFARAKAEDMAEKNYPDKDRHLRTAAAFSTLGYFPDPVLPGFLDLTEAAIVNLVVHELVHATLYIAGNGQWNETVATALGDAGQAVLLRHWGRDDLLDATEKNLLDRQRWGELIGQTLATMRATYEAEPDAAKRLAMKTELIANFKKKITETDWHNPGYRRLADSEINHAFLLANEVYLSDADYQTALTKAAREDYAATVRFLRCVATHKSDDPWQLPGQFICPKHE